MLKTKMQLEEAEKSYLSLYAVTSLKSLGRVYPEREDAFRMCFQRDRDRIIHCKAFRRLKRKTQVFISHYGDHYRTRLTHSLEVAQISRDISRTLGLNEDLAEAIALAHDLGHTPFGHMGEQELDRCLKPFGLHFEHNEQSLRIVETLEHLYPNFHGLNLSKEVREGMIKHETPWDNPKNLHTDNLSRPSLEAQIVNFADEIAYTNHDIDDGLRSGILNFKNLEKLELLAQVSEDVQRQYGHIEDLKIRRARMVSKMISTMIDDIYEETEKMLKKYAIQSLEDVYKSGIKLVQFSENMDKKVRETGKFLYDKLYLSEKVFKASLHGQKVIRQLFEQYYEHPKFLPKKLVKTIEQDKKKEEVIRDYIAGMTDHFAMKKVKNAVIIKVQ